MHLAISKSGGLAGFDRDQVAIVDTSGLAGAAAQAVAACIAELEGEAPSIGTDMVRYDIYARDDGGRVHQFSVADDGNPQSTLRRLLTLLDVAP